MFCLICNKFFETNEEVRDHVIKEHKKAMFTSSLKWVHTTECKKAPAKPLHDDACTCNECHEIDLLISPSEQEPKKEMFRHSFKRTRDGLTTVRELVSTTECKCVICRGIEEEEPAEKRHNVHDDACICQYCKPLGAEWKIDDEQQMGPMQVRGCSHL